MQALSSSLVIKSFSTGSWKNEEVELMNAIGNQLSVEIFEAARHTGKLQVERTQDISRPVPTDAVIKKREWVVEKYIRGTFLRKNVKNVEVSVEQILRCLAQKDLHGLFRLGLTVRWTSWDDPSVKPKSSSSSPHLSSRSQTRYPISDLVDWFKLPVKAYHAAEEEESVPLLHFSVACGFTSLTTFLLLRGVNNACLDEKHRTSLHYAVAFSQVADLNLLLRTMTSRDLEQVDIMGETALSLSLKKNVPNITKLIHLKMLTEDFAELTRSRRALVENSIDSFFQGGTATPSPFDLDATHRATKRRGAVDYGHQKLDFTSHPGLSLREAIIRHFWAKGIHPKDRQKTWKMLAVSIIEQSAASSGKWEKVRALVKDIDEVTSDAIDKDVPRTVPHMTTEFERTALRNLLRSFATSNPSIGYCQSFSYIGAHIIRLFTSSSKKYFTNPRRLLDDSQSVMTALIRGLLPEQFYTGRMESLIVDVAVFHDLVESLLPRLHQHLNSIKEELEPSAFLAYVSKWFSTLFTSLLPYETVLRLWDSLLSCGECMLFAVGV